MSQHDFNIANQGFPATRADLNNALQALASNSSGDAEPSTTFANQWWYETDTNTLKLRNEANNAWLSFATVDQTTAAWTLAHDVTVSNGLTVNGAFTSLGIDDNATSNAITIDSSENVGIGAAAPISKLDVNSGDIAISSTQASDNGDLGEFQFWNTTNAGSGSGSSFVNDVAAIQGQMQGTGNNSGGSLHFYTKADGGAKTEQMAISGEGNVGIGTTSPATHLEVASPASTPAILRISSNKTGAGAGDKSRLEFYSADNSGTAYETGYMVYDRSDTTGTASYIAWANRAAGTVEERMRISGNQVFIACTAAPSATVAGVRLGNPNVALCAFSSGTSTVETYQLGFYNGNGLVGRISTSGSATSYTTSSDYRLKQDWQLMSGASERVLALKPVNFEWISSGDRVDGFLAHEVQGVVPEAVSGTKDAMMDEEYEVTAAVEATYDEDGNELTAAVEAVMGTRSVPDYQGIDQSKLVPLLTAALQEALTKISALEDRVAALEV
jgi:hypothetical protein